MQWSQLQLRVRELMCPQFRKRVKFHKAVYRKSPSQMSSRAWITLDGKEVFECNDDKWRNACQAFNKSGSPSEDEPINVDTERKLASEGIYPTDFLSRSLHLYVDTAPQKALQSLNPVIKAFALLDQRVGKNTLESFKPDDGDHPLVRLFFQLRREIQMPA